jgi:cation diffusion facilitator CzcD-associated flavoprotein CzcO
LEQDYYEQLDKPHVTIVDVKQNPVSHVVPEGTVTHGGKLHEFDIVALITGFEPFTDGLKDMSLVGLKGQPLIDKRRDGAWTAYGIAVSGFPNFFFHYGPQAPTALANGPLLMEPQGYWVVDLLKRMRGAGQTRINATEEAESEWKREINLLNTYSLRSEVESWHTGANVSGKPRQPLIYA